MVFGQLFNSAQNLFGSLKNKVTNWMSGATLAPGGYNYCGPGNPLENGSPKNATDSACKVHDYEYTALAKNKDKISKNDLNRMIRESDNKLIDSIDRAGDNDLGALMSKYLIMGKNKLEDWNLLNPDLFVKQ
jgi:hypothetical protein